MTNQRIKISKQLIVAIEPILIGSHARLDSLLLSAGAPMPIPAGSHAHKWKDWMDIAGKDPNVDNYQFLGGLIEEFMDVPPPPDLDAIPNFGGPEVQSDRMREYEARRKGIEDALARDGLQYRPGGIIVPFGVTMEYVNSPVGASMIITPPSTMDEVLRRILKGLRRAMHPLTNRRKGLTRLAFENEYDVHDLLHALLRPWIRDIRPEEYTPSYAGKSTRMDLLLPDHSTVIELKFVRDVTHGKAIGQELQIDINHYRQHQKCKALYCVIFDPHNLLVNGDGLIADLQGHHSQEGRGVDVTVLIL